MNSNNNIYIPPTQIAPGVYSTGGNATIPGNSPGSNVITSASLAPTSPITPAYGSIDPNSYSSAINGSLQTLEERTATADTYYKSLLEKAKGESGNVSFLTSLLGGKAADTYGAYEMGGVNAKLNDYNKYVGQLAELNAQAKGLNREAAAIPLITQENNRNTGATDSGVAPQNAGELRKNAIKALSIAAQSDIATAAATGSYNAYVAAKDKVDQLVNIKYSQIEADLKARMINLDALDKYDLSPADKKLQVLQQQKLTAEERVLNEKKTNEKEAGAMALDLQRNGAPADVVAKALKATSAREIQSIPGVSNYLMSKSEKLDLAIKQLTYNKLKNPTDTKEAPTIKSINGVDMQWDGTKWVPPTADSTTGGAQQMVIERGAEKVLQLNNLINDTVGINSSSGAYRAAGPGQVLKVADWRADVKNVLSRLTVDELGRVKADGVTFGALSDPERKAVGDAASALNAGMIMDKNGQPTSRFKLSEAKVKKELETIQKFAKIDFEKRTGMTYEDVYLNRITPSLQESTSPYSVYLTP